MWVVYCAAYLQRSATNSHSLYSSVYILSATLLILDPHFTTRYPNAQKLLARSSLQCLRFPTTTHCVDEKQNTWQGDGITYTKLELPSTERELSNTKCKLPDPKCCTSVFNKRAYFFTPILPSSNCYCASKYICISDGTRLYSTCSFRACQPVIVYRSRSWTKAQYRSLYICHFRSTVPGSLIL